MKRKAIICTLILTTLMLSGCTKKTTQGAENSSAANSATQSSTATTSTTNNTTQSTTTHTTDTTHTETGTHDTATHDGTATQSTDHTQTGTTQNTGDTGNMISEAEAKQIALTHAGLTADQVTFIKSGTDRDDGRVTYDVEFYTKDNKEYDYEIDPYTGEVLDYDHDAEYYTSAADTKDAKTISADEAKKIALKQVSGATEQDLREFESDYDNGKLKYEGKIYYKQTEYEFEIDGYDGTILEWDVEPIYGGVS